MDESKAPDERRMGYISICNEFSGNQQKERKVVKLPYLFHGHIKAHILREHSMASVYS